MAISGQFILNDRIIDTTPNRSMTLLDFIRYEQNLTGTKIGCREGDCGACTVLIGSLQNGIVEYKSVVSCLTPLYNALGKHVVTIEGLNLPSHVLSPIQKAIVENNGTQCGACTPGFVVSLTGQILLNLISEASPGQLQQSIDGNICRCTGYKSIERSVSDIAAKISALPDVTLTTLIKNDFIPPYFENIPKKLSALSDRQTILLGEGRLIAGGTDLYVQMHETLIKENPRFIRNYPSFDFIEKRGDEIVIGSASTSSDIMTSKVIIEVIPNIQKYFELIASTPIRNLATIGGNIVNASPIADMVIFFLPFQPRIKIINPSNASSRVIELTSFYLGYKTLDLKPDELIESLAFTIPSSTCYFAFEKTSKRKILDIASVNSAIRIEMDSTKLITLASISAGGIAPIPKHLEISSNWLVGHQVSVKTLNGLLKQVSDEIVPISDIRGSKEYKSLLLNRQIIGHFVDLFPENISLQEVL